MALPQKIQINAITGASQPSQIDNDINNLKQALVDIFGIPNNTNVSTAVMTVNASGLDNVIFRDTAGNPDVSGELQRNGSVLKFHNGSAVRTLMTLEGNQTVTGELTLTGDDLDFAAGAGVEIGTTDAFGLSLKTNNTARYTVTSVGQHLFGTSVATGSGQGDVVMGNNSSLRFVRQDGTTSSSFGLSASTSDNLLFLVPTLADNFQFGFSSTIPFMSLNFDATGNGPQFKFDVVSTTDHAAPGANQCVIYTRLSGGKTQLVARFDSGAVQVIAAEP